jgi:hypothetical protein
MVALLRSKRKVRNVSVVPLPTPAEAPTRIAFGCESPLAFAPTIRRTVEVGTISLSELGSTPLCSMHKASGLSKLRSVSSTVGNKKSSWQQRR